MARSCQGVMSGASNHVGLRPMPPAVVLTWVANVVRRLYHFGRSVSDLAQACRLMGEGAYDRLHAGDVRLREADGQESGDLQAPEVPQEAKELRRARGAGLR